mgnify:CR=1 FL=1
MALNAETYSNWVRQGFRRSGIYAYRPHCDDCQACQSLRVDVNSFEPNRSMRRTWSRHSDLQTRISPPMLSASHFDLYKRYQGARHPGGGMDGDDLQQYADFLLNSQVDTRLVEFFNPTNQQLEMVSVIDCLDDGWSAVYTFYDPSIKGSLGTYSVLWQLEQLKQRQLPWLYLGYWIANSNKMAYKTQFQPFQLYRNGTWE